MRKTEPSSVPVVRSLSLSSLLFSISLRRAVTSPKPTPTPSHNLTHQVQLSTWRQTTGKNHLGFRDFDLESSREIVAGLGNRCWFGKSLPSFSISLRRAILQVQSG
ncbi:hypothetical protein Droror1_Dr00016172 [Drosera rotundifolia]